LRVRSAERQTVASMRLRLARPTLGVDPDPKGDAETVLGASQLLSFVHLGRFDAIPDIEGASASNCMGAQATFGDGQDPARSLSGTPSR